MRIGLSFLAVVIVAGCHGGEGRPKAVYLVAEKGELSAEDLKAHPEVVVAHSFEEFSRQAKTKIALWIDKGAIPMVDEPWLHKAPQKFYPVAVVGYWDDLYAFREQLGGYGIHGPYVDWSRQTVQPGFSVWMIKEETRSGRSAWMKGYPGAPTVQAILTVTNRLLKGKPPD